MMLAGICVLSTGCGNRRDSKVIAFVGNTETGEYYEINQELWQGVSAYATESGAEASIYTPEDLTLTGARRSMMAAIEDGADIVVCAGEQMANAVYDLQQLENKTEFLLVDGVPTDGSGVRKPRIRGNTYSVLFTREEAGFLAGYAAVAEGYRKIGFLGGSAGSDDTRYGSGFIQGAEAAGKALGYVDGEVEIRYRLMTSNAISPSLVSEIGGWFGEGCELICVSGSGPEFIGPVSASEAGGRIITADMNSLDDEDCIVAASGINNNTVVQIALKELEDGELKGGRRNEYGIAEGGVSMKLKEGAFQNFSLASYEELVEQIRNGDIKISGDDVTENLEKSDIKICHITGLESE